MRNGEDWSQATSLRAEQSIGYAFLDKQLLLQCFTHASYSNLHPETESNERLEFLGDAVLQLFVSEQLFKHSPQSREGKLTAKRQKIVSQEALTGACERANLMPFLRYSGKQENLGGKTPSNLFEAVIAGIYLDGGMQSASAFMERFLLETDTVNYKGLLQEFVQARKYPLPEYVCEEGNGGEYICTVTAMGRKGTGVGKGKSSAEMKSAEALYKILKEDEAK